VDDIFKYFVPMQLACLRKYTTLLPHVAEVTQKFQKEGIKIGSSTGFVRSMVDILEEDTKKQGYTPDASVAGDEGINGARPKPFMVYRNLDLMNGNPIQSVVKVDDTVSGVGEALETGCWGVGIARYNNYMDMDTLEEAGSLSEEEIQRRLIKTRDILQKSGAHYVIDTFDQLVDVVDDVNLQLSRGERP
jgi:phosphonoacetaldehyde hydrolase